MHTQSEHVSFDLRHLYRCHWWTLELRAWLLVTERTRRTSPRPPDLLSHLNRKRKFLSAVEILEMFSGQQSIKGAVWTKLSSSSSPVLACNLRRLYPPGPTNRARLDTGTRTFSVNEAEKPSRQWNTAAPEVIISSHSNTTPTNDRSVLLPTFSWLCDTTVHDAQNLFFSHWDDVTEKHRWLKRTHTHTHRVKSDGGLPEASLMASITTFRGRPGIFTSAWRAHSVTV